MNPRISLIFVFIYCFILFGQSKNHPLIFTTNEEALAIKNALGKLPLLDHSFQTTSKMIDAILGRPIDIPPPGEGGGYAHERHKQNYREMQAGGLLYQITGEEKYAIFIRKMLIGYAEVYPKLGPHPLAHNQAPGKLFHQMLNETVWLVNTAQAYDCIYDWLSASDKKIIETNIFEPMIEWFTVERKHEFNRIHNHGTWSVASIGMLGYVLGRQDLVDIALYGTEKDGNGGFLKQLDMLFSPDGYYMEGPYYVRYALRPFFLFAEAVERNQPDLKIFKYRDQILKKAYYSAVQTTFPNGVFAPINDASRTMNVEAIGVVIANDITFYRYGSDPNLLGVAKLQNQVILNGAGLALARKYKDGSLINIPDWKSVEFTDGYDGKQGGLGIVRHGTGVDQAMLLMKYGVHGEGHGHFDKLHFSFFEQGMEVVPDYGFARWINIEPKFGGRYLPENKSYAMQTVAHNTVVVDQKTQNKGDRDEADKVAGRRHFFSSENPDLQVISARANDHYPGVKMQRTMFLVNDQKLEYPIIVDLYRLASKEQHTYDYVLHYDGQMITTNSEYQSFTTDQIPLGIDNGYQHIWKVAESVAPNGFKFTWLSKHRYYTITTASTSQKQVLFGRTGANDPNFNLRSEPLLILRDSGSDYLFASVIEPHGYFNEAAEKSNNARGQIETVEVVGHNDRGSIIEIKGKDNLKWRIMVNNGPSTQDKIMVKFADSSFDWNGNFRVNLNAE